MLHSALRIPHSALAAVILLSGCAGYQIGNRALYRPDIRTVHVPVVQSDSYRRYLGERLTEASGQRHAALGVELIAVRAGEIRHAPSLLLH